MVARARIYESESESERTFLCFRLRETDVSARMNPFGVRVSRVSSASSGMCFNATGMSSSSQSTLRPCSARTYSFALMMRCFRRSCQMLMVVGSAAQRRAGRRVLNTCLTANTCVRSVTLGVVLHIQLLSRDVPMPACQRRDPILEEIAIVSERTLRPLLRLDDV